jgi:hypothetical protein
MKTTVRCLLVLVMLIVVAVPIYSAAQAQSAAPAKPAAPAESADSDSYDLLQVLHVFVCEMSPGITEADVDAMAQHKLEAIRQMPGGENAKVQILWPAAVSNMGTTDFWIVWIFPSFSDWGKLWDAYEDDTPLARGDDATEGKVECPDSMIWETHAIVLPK